MAYTLYYGSDHNVRKRKILDGNDIIIFYILGGGGDQNDFGSGLYSWLAAQLYPPIIYRKQYRGEW